MIDVEITYLWGEERKEYIGQFGALEVEIAWLPDEGYRLVGHLGRGDQRSSWTLRASRIPFWIEESSSCPRRRERRRFDTVRT